MARGITIGEVTNKMENVVDAAVLPVSSGESTPEVVEVGTLKDYINLGPNSNINALSSRVDGMASVAMTNIEIENLLNNSI